MAKVKGARPRRTKKVVEAEGVAHIQATFNNTIITIADSQGNTVVWVDHGCDAAAAQRLPASQEASRLRGFFRNGSLYRTSLQALPP